jgi:hypothetical protein
LGDQGPPGRIDQAETPPGAVDCRWPGSRRAGPPHRALGGHHGWNIELFFKWIKQNLHIKSFYGTSDNAVRTQVWIAISVYVLVAIVKKELEVDRSLSEILQILSLTLFEKTPIFQALSEQETQDPEPPFPNQLNLFDL